MDVFSAAQKNHAAGAWCSLNPVFAQSELKGKASGDDDVTDYRYALVECDEMTKEEQWRFLHCYHLPIQSVVWSGGKSLHAIVRIKADNNKLVYKERVDRLYAYLECLGVPIDKANRNPSRLTRLPGFQRSDDMQYYVAYQMGPESW